MFSKYSLIASLFLLRVSDIRRQWHLSVFIEKPKYIHAFYAKKHSLISEIFYEKTNTSVEVNDTAFSDSFGQADKSFESMCIMQLQKEYLTFLYFSAGYSMMGNLYKHILEWHTCFDHFSIIEKKHISSGEKLRQIIEMIVMNC